MENEQEAGPPTRSAQETFDHVVGALRKQGRPAVKDGCDACYYRAGELKCAAGHAIPDDRYDPEMEGLPVVRIYQDATRRGRPDPFDGHDREVLIGLQQAHDRAAAHDPEWLPGFITRARALGQTLGLDLGATERDAP